MKAKFLSTEGTYLEAVIEIEGQRYCVMDEITLDEDSMPKLGESFAFEFSNLIDENESWDSIFQGNPEKKKCLEQISGWKYKAYGEITSIEPVRIDCGILIEEEVVNTKDSRVIGEFVAFTISRLGGCAI